MNILRGGAVNLKKPEQPINKQAWTSSQSTPLQQQMLLKRK